MSKYGIGQPVLRFEDPRLLRGQGRYISDVNLHGQAYAIFVRSPHAFADIRSIDTDAAKAVPGVLAVLTATAMEGIGNISQHPPLAGRGGQKLIIPHRPALAGATVRQVGEAVAVVVAESRYLAEDAAAAVAVDFEVLPAVSDCRDAAKPDAARAHSDLARNIAAVVPMSYGDVDAAFAMRPDLLEQAIVQDRAAGERRRFPGDAVEAVIGLLGEAPAEVHLIVGQDVDAEGAAGADLPPAVRSERREEPDQGRVERYRRERPDGQAGGPGGLVRPCGRRD